MRISLFVDGANYYFMQKKALGWWIDAKKLISYARTFGELINATYYVGVAAPHEAQQQAFLDLIIDYGFSLETKQIKEIIDDETGEKIKKANLDIEIVLDMFNTIDHYDMAILISGDGDFERPLQLLKARGKQFKVLSTKGFVSHGIKTVAGMHYIDMVGLKDQIEHIRKNHAGC